MNILSILKKINGPAPLLFLLAAFASSQAGAFTGIVGMKQALLISVANSTGSLEASDSAETRAHMVKVLDRPDAPVEAGDPGYLTNLKGPLPNWTLSKYRNDENTLSIIDITSRDDRIIKIFRITVNKRNGTPQCDQTASEMVHSSWAFDWYPWTKLFQFGDSRSYYSNLSACGDPIRVELQTNYGVFVANW